MLRTRLGSLPLTSWLHYASSIAGILILVVWVRSWVVRTPRGAGAGTVRRGIRHLFWAAVIVAFGIGGLVTWMIGIAAGSPPFESYLVFRVARVSIGSMLGVVAVICVGWLVYRERSTATTLPSTSA